MTGILPPCHRRKANWFGLIWSIPSDILYSILNQVKKCQSQENFMSNFSSPVIQRLIFLKWDNQYGGEFPSAQDIFMELDMMLVVVLVSSFGWIGIVYQYSPSYLTSNNIGGEWSRILYRNSILQCLVFLQTKLYHQV